MALICFDVVRVYLIGTYYIHAVRCIHNRSLRGLFVCRSSEVALFLESQQVYLRVLFLVKLFQLTVICEVPS